MNKEMYVVYCESGAYSDYECKDYYVLAENSGDAWGEFKANFIANDIFGGRCYTSDIYYVHDITGEVFIAPFDGMIIGADRSRHEILHCYYSHSQVTIEKIKTLN
jgi:hypothetical protein